ncbi:MAG TPA: hypothetical protein VJ617_12445 [Arthrobacter sp.]|nr:hypothetical protein [Arthrobacter sp.]
MGLPEFTAGNAPDAEPGLPAARSVLAARQQELVAALVADGAVPDGFDPARVAAVRLGLARKRLGGLGQHFPALAAAVRSDPALWELYFGWHIAHPPGPMAGYFADGAGLIDFLDQEGRLPPAATREALMLRMDTSPAPDGQRIPARWLGVRQVRVAGQRWWAAGSHRRWAWIRGPRGGG